MQRIKAVELNLNRLWEIGSLYQSGKKFSVITSIRFGLLTIEFSGSGYLRGKQPLLAFFISLIELKLRSKILLRRSLIGPKAKEELFFSLIALENNGDWLSARGQGGALVLWLKG